MIEAIVFDLDGTLVQTEELKAKSYALAAAELAAGRVREAEVMEKFREFVGLDRERISKQLLEVFGLEEAARSRMVELGVDAPWKAFAQLRSRRYEEMLKNEDLIRQNAYPACLALLRTVRAEGFKTALATMSHLPHTTRILEILDIQSQFDAIVTREDVEHAKPHPEIYLVTAGRLGLEPWMCLVIEDSAPGVQSAVTAGMWCIAVPSDLTRKGIHESRLLQAQWIVEDPKELGLVAKRLIRQVTEAA